MEAQKSLIFQCRLHTLRATGGRNQIRLGLSPNARNRLVAISGRREFESLTAPKYEVQLKLLRRLRLDS